jgi:hypothetical protein
MAASNESQGLKIAVAVFIALSVILAVTCYFLYSNYSVADARLTKTNEDLNTAKKGQSILQTHVEELRGRIGTRAEEAEAAKAEIDAHYKKVYGSLQELGNKVTAAMQKVQQSGAPQQEVQDLHGRVQQAIQSFQAEKNLNYISSLDRMTELMENLSLLTTEMGANYLDLRHALESATKVTNEQVNVQTKAAEAARADVLDEQKKHTDERQSLLVKVEALTKDNDIKTTQIANLSDQVRQLKEDHLKEKDLLTGEIRDWRDKAERSDVILDHPDGHITYVDHEARDQSSSSRVFGGANTGYTGGTGEVHVNINRAMGARPQMMMSVFDARSPGVPTEKPKGTIQLTSVGDRISVGRIVKTMSPTEPIRVGDIVYSAAWSPNSPTRFALVGLIDVNRDGRDDRQELKRMIEEAGGVVEYDLPPPWVGKETGKLTPRIDWYVTDDRAPFREVYQVRSEPMEKMSSELNRRVGEVTKEARLDGIRPMPIGKLLAYLGYDMNTPVLGQSEAVNQDAIRRITAKKPGANAGVIPGAGISPAEKKKADENGEEMPKEETPKKKANDEGGNP